MTRFGAKAAERTTSHACSGAQRALASRGGAAIRHPRESQRTLCAATAALVTFLLVFVNAGCAREGKVSDSEFRGAPIILVSIDTLRSDRLPVYGYSNVQTPAIDALAKDGIVFERTYSNVPLTLPSHLSILTGLFPFEHGARNNIGYQFDAKKHPPITASLKKAGYDTAATVSAYVLRGNTGISAAFDYYDDAIAPESGVAIGNLQRSGLATLESAKSWIEQRRNRPFLLMFHIFEPHAPYSAPEPWRSRYRDPYDAEVAAADDIVGKLMEHLKTKGLYDGAVVILLSDHGEGLGEHGEDEHGIFLYREALQVPLVIKLPSSKRAGERVASLVQLIDIAPTIAFLTGVESPPGSKGINVFNAAAFVPGRRLYAETLYPRLHLGWSELRSLIEEQYHYIEAPKPELYDIAADPAETRNILVEQRRAYASMRNELATYARTITAPGAVDSEEASKLAALGYVGSVRTAEGDLPDPKDRIADIGTLRKATYLSAAGRQSEAAALLREVLSSNSRFADAWVLLATVYEGMGRYEDAIAAYGEAIRTAPTSAAEYALSMAGLFMKLKRLDDAKKHAEIALEHNPAGAHQSLARIAMASGDFGLAERELGQAMLDESAKARAMVTLAQVKAKQGRLGEALRILEQTRADAQAKQMRVESLEYALGDLYATMNRNSEAEQAFRREIAMFPGNLSAYSSLAVVLVLDKKYKAVDTLFAEMAQKNPTRQAYLVAAETYEALGDTRTASQWRSRAAQAQ